MEAKLYIIYKKTEFNDSNIDSPIITYIGTNKKDSVDYFNKTYRNSKLCSTNNNVKECVVELREYDSPWTRIKSFYTLEEQGILIDRQTLESK